MKFWRKLNIVADLLQQALNNRHMARRNRKSRKANQSNSSGKNAQPTAEELQQERSFFMWAGIITLVIVVGLYLAFS